MIFDLKIHKDSRSLNSDEIVSVKRVLKGIIRSVQLSNFLLLENQNNLIGLEFNQQIYLFSFAQIWVLLFR